MEITRIKDVMMKNVIQYVKIRSVRECASKDGDYQNERCCDEESHTVRQDVKSARMCE